MQLCFSTYYLRIKSGRATNILHVLTVRKLILSQDVHIH